VGGAISIAIAFLIWSGDLDVPLRAKRWRNLERGQPQM